MDRVKEENELFRRILREDYAWTNKEINDYLNARI